MESNFQLEQKRVSEVVGTIAEQVGNLEKETSRRRKELVHTRKHFWDEIKVNIDSFDDFLETVIGMRQETQVLSTNQSTEKLMSQKLIKLQKMQNNPYFGRIDFLEEDESDEEEIYIGISSLMDSSGHDFLVYDWRAPISSVYYEYQNGPAAYSTPSGKVHGVLQKKMQYLIRKGRLQSMFDTSLTIGDEILQQVLGKGTDKYMHNIVATIQQKQNRIIRHDRGKLLIVQGAAGSGKTSAALQRIAYLLYKYRNQISPDQIILFSPNSIFNSYVSNVLPELGEENMQQVTFQHYLTHRLSEEFQIEDPYEQLETVLTAANTPSYKVRIAEIKFKASMEFFNAIEAYQKSLESAGMAFKDIHFRGEVLISAAQIGEYFYSHHLSLRLPNRLEKLKEWLLSEIKQVQETEIEAPWVEARMELLSDEEYHKAQIFLAKKKGMKRDEVGDYEVTAEALARLIVQQKMKPLIKQVRAMDFINDKELYMQLFKDPQLMQGFTGRLPAEWPEICNSTLETVNEARLFYEDATPFLLLRELIHGFQANGSIKHIIIDEAQDYSPFQFEFLKRLFPFAKMTVLGDFNQAIFAHANESDDFQQLLNLYGEDETERINLTQSYRSTKPIIEFTRKLMPNGDDILPFDRNGERPVLTEVSGAGELHRSIISSVEDLQKRGFNSIAILCKSAAESEQAFRNLSAIDGLKLLRKSANEYEQGVVVIPAYLAKGIEFDAVIIYDASKEAYSDESQRRIFYTACTRALHYLQLYSVGELTSLVGPDSRQLVQVKKV